jgi:type 2 lantibiotic biosynthesis protein LanM
VTESRIEESGVVVQCAEWSRALTMQERAALLDPADLKQRQTTEHGQRRFERWQAQFPTPAIFAERLALDGLTAAQLHTILDESIEALHSRQMHAPGWLDTLAEAYARPQSSYPLPLPAVFHKQPAAQFLDAIEPLIGHSRDRLREQLQALSARFDDLPFDPATIDELLLTTLPWKPLAVMLGRVMARELHIARLREALPGDTPEARFAGFVASLRDRGTAIQILQTYPVLARHIVLTLDQWIANSLELVERLCADWDAIQTLCGSRQSPGRLSAIQGNVGDTHRRGRLVQILQFDSGFRVVYKPRSVAVDAHFQELLLWLNQRGTHPPFRTLTVIDRGSYGWIEFITAGGCADVAAVRRFYQRQGAYLALLHLLDGTDFYFENLIAAGEDPMLIDLESLFQPRLGDDEQTTLLGGNLIEHTLLRIGMLPRRLWSTAEHSGVDLSGLGAAAGQMLPSGALTWEQPGTDQMRIVFDRIPVPENRNRPTIDGAAVALADYTEAIVAGFSEMYRLLQRERAALAAPDGPLARFADDEVRVILRPTITYATLLRESFHPDLLRDALERDRFFDQLWLAVQHRPYLAHAVAAEREDIWHGDIPMFTTRPGARSVWDSCGRQIADLLDQPVLEALRQRLAELDDRALVQHLWFIRASIATTTAPQPDPGYQLVQTAGTVSAERFLAAARAIGDRLAELAIRYGNQATWTGLMLDGSRSWALVPLRCDLYGGQSGVVLFLAYLGAVTAEQRYTELARAGLELLRIQLQHEQNTTELGIGFEGWGGIIYTLAQLGTLWHDPAIVDEARQLVQHALPQIDHDTAFDLMSGAAGWIGAVLTLYHLAPDTSLRTALLRAGDRLLACAQAQEQGIGWVTPLAPEPLAGFAHGSAGIAWALAELATTTGEERFLSAARQAIDHERTLFSAESGWPGLGSTDQQHAASGSMIAWCYGAAGIGLSRLQMLRHVDDPRLRDELAIALKLTLAQGFGGNHSLCHGDLGNLELLLQASASLDDPALHTALSRISTAILADIEQHGWRCGVPLPVETPTLMTGIAGIGYQLLRLAATDRVPALLTLAPAAADSSKPATVSRPESR